MNYVTLEVEIRHGKVVPKEPVTLPERANGLLTILQPDTETAGDATPLRVLETLHNHLRLDHQKAAAWMAVVRDARR